MSSNFPPNGNGSPWWTRTASIAIANLGPLVVGFFAMLVIVCIGAYYILTQNPVAVAQQDKAEILRAIKDGDDNIRAEVMANRNRQVEILERSVEGQKQICRLLAVNQDQEKEFCNF